MPDISFFFFLMVIHIIISVTDYHTIMTFFLFVFHGACRSYPCRYCVILGQRIGSDQINQSNQVSKVNVM